MGRGFELVYLGGLRACTVVLKSYLFIELRSEKTDWSIVIHYPFTTTLIQLSESIHPTQEVALLACWLGMASASNGPLWMELRPKSHAIPRS